MAKVQSSRAKIYEKKASVADEPTEHIESEGERLIKQLVLKQIDTQVTLSDQLKQTKEFEKSTEYVPLTKYTSGQTSLQEFEECANQASYIEDLKSSGLTDEEVELILDHNKGEEFFSEKYRKLEHSVLNSWLHQIFLKLKSSERAQQQDDARQSISRNVSRHEQELGLSVKPNSEHTKLLQFALSCQQSSSSADIRPPNHPINQLKDLEHELFGHLKNKGQQQWQSKRSISATSSPKFKSKQPKLVTVPSLSESSEKTSSLWDLKDTCTFKSSSIETANKPCHVYTCKPETLYTIKNKKIIPINKDSPFPIPARTASHITSGCSGQPFVLSDIEDSEIKTLSKEDIQKNRLSVEEIKLLPRFQNYDTGPPSQVLFVKNLPNRIKETELVAVFGHLDSPGEQRIIYRLMTGKMKGQAFVTFPSVEKATAALELANGFILRKKPMVIQYGHTESSFIKCKMKAAMESETMSLDLKQ